MWLLPPSMHSASSAAPACSTPPPASPVTLRDTGFEPWVTSSGTPQRRPSSWPAWKQRPWSERLFGATASPAWTPDLFEDGLTSSSPLRPVSRTAPPASAAATPTNAASETVTGRSPTSHASSTSVAPPWSSSRMFQSGSQTGIFEDSGKNFAEWVSTSRRRSSSLRDALEARTGESECSAWLTPHGANGNHGPNGSDCAKQASTWPTPDAMEGADRAFKNNSKQGRHLGTDAAKWSTPNVPTRGPETRQSKAQTRGTTTGIDLQSQVIAWPSPRAEDAERCGNHPGSVDSLTGVVSTWATPTDCTKGGGKTRSGDRSGEMLLPGQAAAWPTAQATDDRNTSGGRGPTINPTLRTAATLLSRQVAPSSTTSWPKSLDAIQQRWGLSRYESLELLMPCDSGLRSLLQVWTPPSCPRLSAAFQWWLMRWPHPRATCSASEATAWTSWWRRMRSTLSSLVTSST